MIVMALKASLIKRPGQRRTFCTLYDGVRLANLIKSQVKENIIDFQSRNEHFKPKLVAIAVGNNPASDIYLKRKEEAAEYCGLDFNKISLQENVEEVFLRDLIEKLNNEKKVSGIIVQLPLPHHMSEIEICNSVSPAKDVDGFTQTNLGKLMQNVGEENNFIPCTALAVKKIISSLDMKAPNNAVVIGRSHNVGLPIQIILGSDRCKGGFDMTVTLCHRNTPPADLITALSSADLVVSAAGVPGLLHKNIIKPGAVVIDVGLNRVEGNKVTGDCERSVREVAGLLTPVPGGVGPVTVACLMYNTWLAATQQQL